jgi:hypothetical protein
MAGVTGVNLKVELFDNTSLFWVAGDHHRGRAAHDRHREEWVEASRLGNKPSSLLRVLVIAASAVLLVGCNGGTVDRHALTNDAATLDSIACEGALLAHNAARGRTTTYYTREQAEELKIQLGPDLVEIVVAAVHHRRRRGPGRLTRG